MIKKSTLSLAMTLIFGIRLCASDTNIPIESIDLAPRTVTRLTQTPGAVPLIQTLLCQRLLDDFQNKKQDLLSNLKESEEIDAVFLDIKVLAHLLVNALGNFQEAFSSLINEGEEGCDLIHRKNLYESTYYFKPPNQTLDDYQEIVKECRELMVHFNKLSAATQILIELLTALQEENKNT
jgi:hypothetical protein